MAPSSLLQSLFASVLSGSGMERVACLLTCCGSAYWNRVCWNTTDIHQSDIELSKGWKFSCCCSVSVHDLQWSLPQVFLNGQVKHTYNMYNVNVHILPVACLLKSTAYFFQVWHAINNYFVQALKYYATLIRHECFLSDKVVDCWYEWYFNLHTDWSIVMWSILFLHSITTIFVTWY